MSIKLRIISEVKRVAAEPQAALPPFIKAYENVPA
jgi:hypothetical protein